MNSSAREMPSESPSEKTREKTPKSSFDWHLVRSFLAVLDAGSLLGAAKKLKASQPTLGRQVAELERQLGVLLFERTGRGLTPTQAALGLAASARSMQVAALELAAAVSTQAHVAEGIVTLSASTPVAHGLLPPLLARMAEALPKIRVDVIATNAVSNLLQREADIALRMVQPEQLSAVAKRVGQVRLGVWAHERYLAAHPILLTPQQLVQHRLITDLNVGDIARGFARMGVPLPHEQIVFRSDDFLAQWGAVRAGLGIGFVSNYLARTDPQVKAVLPDLPIPGIPMWLVAHREVRSVARVRAVFDWLGDALPAALA